MSNNNMDSALAEYLAECSDVNQRIAEHLRIIEKGVVGSETIDSLYRDIHTLKGSSQLFGFKQLGDLTHAMENTLEPVRRNQVKLQPEMVDILLKCLDVIDQLLESIGETSHEKDSSAEISSLIAELSKKPATAVTPADPQVVPMITPTSEAEAAEAIAAAAKTATPNSTPMDSKKEAHSEGSADLSSSIRVPVTLLDRLMNLMGEMVLVRNQVLQYANQSDDLGFLNLSQRLDVVTSEIQGEVMKTRMQPIGGILSKFHRVTRDLAKELNKKIELSLVGMETELDKTLLEAVKDPIMHIVRNSCDHGLETIEDRRAAGKDVTGNVQIRSYHEGGQVIVEISDDGRGLIKEKLIAKAVEKGLITTERAATLSERDAFGLIFAPGFSTASVVTNVSGRGVGMDVVKSNIEGIGGIVEIHSVPGRGTTTRLKIPLTLAIVPAMIVRCGVGRFAIPQVKLVELVRVSKEDESSKIEVLQGKPVFRLRGNILPLITLKQVLNIADGPESDNDGVTNIVVLNAEGTLLGLIVDEVQDTAEVVVKPLSNFLKSLLLYSGATVLGDGSVALILDIVGIAQRQNLNTESDNKVKSQGAEAGLLTDDQEFLLFKLNSPTKHAIPLNLVHRLEEFKTSDIEYSGEQRFVRYRNSALPIINLNEFLGFKRSESTGAISVIVTQKSSKLFGIEVDEIYDVLNTSSQMDDSFADRAGIFGNLVTDSELIVVVDTLRILDEVSKSLSVGTPVSTATEAVKALDVQDRTGKILFVEDTVFFRRHVSSVLQRAGFTLSLCENGEEAMQLLEKSQPGDFDLILSDIEMPKMNGLQLAAAIRANATWKNVPLIALTTKFNDIHVEEGRAAGFNAYLEKLKPEILLSAMDKLMKPNERKSA
jgi:two-component system, chemotaxis family, sensor kinase CheA